MKELPFYHLATLAMIKWRSLNAASVLPGDCGRCGDGGVGIGVVCVDRTSKLQRVAFDEVI